MLYSFIIHQAIKLQKSDYFKLQNTLMEYLSDK